MQFGMQYAVGMQYTVGMQYAVGISAKRSTHTVYFLHQHLLCTASPTVWGLTFLH